MSSMFLVWFFWIHRGPLMINNTGNYLVLKVGAFRNIEFGREDVSAAEKKSFEIWMFDSRILKILTATNIQRGQIGQIF